MKKKWFCVTDYIETVPNCGGLYAIYVLNIETYKKKLIYIGIAKNLKIRLRKHEVKKVLNAIIEYPEIIYIKCRIEQNDVKRKKIERYLIDRLQPKANTL